MENDLLECSKKLLTKGYTGIVVSDSNGLPVFGKSSFFCAICTSPPHSPIRPFAPAMAKIIMSLISHSHYASQGRVRVQLPGRVGFLLFSGTLAALFPKIALRTPTIRAHYVLSQLSVPAGCRPRKWAMCCYR
jgi:hypothetical protein